MVDMNMDVRSVLVESVDTVGNSVFGNSGIMLNGRHIITTFNPIAPFLSHSDLKAKHSEGAEAIFRENHSDILKNIQFFVTFKDEGTAIQSQRVNLLSYFFSKKISSSTDHIFRNWTIDTPDNRSFHLLSLFIILEVNSPNKNNELKNDIHNLFDSLSKFTLIKGQNLKCISAAFGNRSFLNHYNEGIVSNILGEDDCLVFSDLSLTPGSEGSPVFCDSSCKFPIGIVVSAINWWKSEWLNFTVIADLRPLLFAIIESKKSVEFSRSIAGGKFKLLNTLELSLFQIYNGTIWGTAILINKDKGIFITNAHVVGGKNIIYMKNKSVLCDVVYSNEESSPIDIAVLKAKSHLEGDCEAIRFSRGKLHCGQLVYAGGFPIFSKETNAGATLTVGHISNVHPHMIKTTCSVYPGASGGAILDEDGGLIAIIVCNAKTSDPVDKVYPKMNMSVPMLLIEPILSRYIESEDMDLLKELRSIDAKIWNFQSKL